ncbi:uncharacterized protein LOC122715892 [Apis laboriosa]|uniref:uncharacterized protein LOC122715892 n=1 Tax=Apis laboriosa TaxID=183418 RepID=UPI001CC377B6|nr:uncharacterized protein LOC122715892 [Apis laboriosa]
MQVHVTSFVFAALLIASMESKPLWPSVRSDDHRYLSTPINVDRGFLQYHDSPYYVYNVHSEVNAAPIIAHGKLAASHLPVYSFYYGTPTYDFRLPLNPVYPLLPAPHPGDQPSTVGAKPIDEDDDGIEKLETKIEGGKKERK